MPFHHSVCMDTHNLVLSDLLKERKVKLALYKSYLVFPFKAGPVMLNESKYSQTCLKQ